MLYLLPDLVVLSLALPSGNYFQAQFHVQHQKILFYPLQNQQHVLYLHFWYLEVLQFLFVRQNTCYKPQLRLHMKTQTQNTKHKTQNTKHKTQKFIHFLPIRVFNKMPLI